MDSTNAKYLVLAALVGFAIFSLATAQAFNALQTASAQSSNTNTNSNNNNNSNSTGSSPLDQAGKALGSVGGAVSESLSKAGSTIQKSLQNVTSGGNNTSTTSGANQSSSSSGTTGSSIGSTGKSTTSSSTGKSKTATTSSQTGAAALQNGNNSFSTSYRISPAPGANVEIMVEGTGMTVKNIQVNQELLNANTTKVTI
ncbi:MAG: hypothetical protein C4292_03690, partial [Nitrososphaera sp.]